MHLGVGCGRKWSKVVSTTKFQAYVDEGGKQPITPPTMVKKPTNTVNEPALTQETEDVCTAFAAELLVTAAILHSRHGSGRRAGHVVKSFRKRRSNVSRQQSGAGGREGAAEGAGGLQAPHRREVRRGVLHHESRRQGGRDLSGGRVAQDRGQACQALELQSIEEKVFEQSELLRADGRDGCARAAADAADPARSGRDQGRRSCLRQPDIPGSPEPGSLEATGRGTVHD